MPSPTRPGLWSTLSKLSSAPVLLAAAEESTVTAEKEEHGHPAPAARPGHWVTTCPWRRRALSMGPALDSGGLGQAEPGCDTTH